MAQAYEERAGQAAHHLEHVAAARLLHKAAAAEKAMEGSPGARPAQAQAHAGAVLAAGVESRAVQQVMASMRARVQAAEDKANAFQDAAAASAAELVAERTEVQRLQNALAAANERAAAGKTTAEVEAEQVRARLAAAETSAAEQRAARDVEARRAAEESAALRASLDEARRQLMEERSKRTIDEAVAASRGIELRNANDTKELALSHESALLRERHSAELREVEYRAEQKHAADMQLAQREVFEAKARAEALAAELARTREQMASEVGSAGPALNVAMTARAEAEKAAMESERRAKEYADGWHRAEQMLAEATTRAASAEGTVLELQRKLDRVAASSSAATSPVDSGRLAALAIAVQTCQGNLMAGWEHLDALVKHKLSQLDERHRTLESVAHEASIILAERNKARASTRLLTRLGKDDAPVRRKASSSAVQTRAASTARAAPEAPVPRPAWPVRSALAPRPTSAPQARHVSVAVPSARVSKRATPTTNAGTQADASPTPAWSARLASSEAARAFAEEQNRVLTRANKELQESSNEAVIEAASESSAYARRAAYAESLRQAAQPARRLSASATKPKAPWVGAVARPTREISSDLIATSPSASLVPERANASEIVVRRPSSVPPARRLKRAAIAAKALAPKTKPDAGWSPGQWRTSAPTAPFDPNTRKGPILRHYIGAMAGTKPSPMKKARRKAVAEVPTASDVPQLAEAAGGAPLVHAAPETQAASVLSALVEEYAGLRETYTNLAASIAQPYSVAAEQGASPAPNAALHKQLQEVLVLLRAKGEQIEVLKAQGVV